MKYILPLMLIFILSTGFVECNPKESFLDRLKDNCAVENGICEDGESPLRDKDCEITTEATSCEGDRCIWNEIWLAKLLIIILLFMVITYKKDYLILILLIFFMLFVNFSTTEYADTLRDAVNNVPVSETKVFLPNESAINQSFFTEWGYKVMPSNPLLGFGILIAVIYVIVRWWLRRRENRLRRIFSRRK